MRLERLAALGFRNLEPLEVHTPSRFVVISGANAQGKTNVLEATWFLATLRPLHSHRSSQLIRWGQEAASVVGDVVDAQGHSHRHKVVLSSHGRKVEVDGQTVDLSTWFEGLRAIAFTPSDARIVSDTPSGRRAWLDRAAFTATPVHLDTVRGYKRLVEQKSAALRGGDPAILDVLDTQLAREGARVAQRRAEVLSELGPHVQALHAEISGTPARVGLRYVTELEGSDLAQREKSLLAVLQRRRPEELRRGHCLAGPQRDELVVSLDDKPARTYGSRGQVRSLVLAMKLSELVAATARGDTPLFLLDDLSSELDRARTRRLVDVLGHLGVQVFVTTTDPGHIEGLPREDTLRLRVRDGVVETSM